MTGGKLLSEDEEDLTNLYPDPVELADDHDADDWCCERDGRMRSFAAPDDTVETIPYEDD